MKKIVNNLFNKKHKDISYLNEMNTSEWRWWHN